MPNSADAANAAEPADPNNGPTNIRIITTGGTLDKVYQPADGSLSFDHTRVPDQLLIARVSVPLTDLMAIDSLDMSDEHRKQVLTCCELCVESRLVITHGTDTMVLTAEVLAAAALNKTIVLTGAMVPLSISGSDGAFNLGCAIGLAQALPGGVWVAMNGVARPWNDVKKDRRRGVFTGSK